MREQEQHEEQECGHQHGAEGHWGEHHYHRHGGEFGGRGHEHHHRGGECGCGRRGPGFLRHFFTREERVAWLEEYLKALQAEAKGVEERIAALKAGD